MIAIVDFDIGNVASIHNMFKRVGAKSIITREPEVIRDSSHVVLPGNGSYDAAMNNLVRFNLLPVLNECCLVNKRPVLGICLGLQLMFERSDEGLQRGLGWLKGKVERFDKELCGSRPIPHMGWNSISLSLPSSILFDREEKDSRYYFVHSYHVKPENREVVAATTDYGCLFVSAVEADNLYGVQFHPEKSLKHGMLLMKRFSDLTTSI